MRRRVLPAVLPVLVGVLALLAGGCTGLPDEGPVVDADAPSRSDDEQASDINAVPPAPNASPAEIVDGFLEAMTASPIRVDVARQFLSASAAGEWDPAAGTITYAGASQPQSVGMSVTVDLVGAERLDGTGAWLGALPTDEQDLDLTLRFEDGQYRITDPPDALVVPDSWFAQRFRQANLYFFDPTGRILVPQPVFVQRGDQLASTLISRVLAGPGDDLRRVTRSFLPAGLSVAVSVPVSADGVAEISLVGAPGPQPGASTEKMLAQLAWTLRQDPTIRALRVSVGGEAVRGPDGEEEYGIEDADVFDPIGASSSRDLFALRDGILARRDGNELEPVPGALGAGGLDPRVASVSLDASIGAAVTRDGRRLLVTPLAEPGADTEPVVDVALRGTDLLRPAWDFADRLWVVDRTTQGAVVHYLAGGRVRRLPVPGVSGENVRSFLVSRDGTRILAVVRDEGGDQLRVGRIEVDERLEVDRVTATETIVVEQGLDLRIRDLAWTSPTTVALLIPDLFEVRAVSVDGSPVSNDAFLPTISEPLTGLVGSPATDVPTYGVTETGLLDLVVGRSYGFAGDPATSVGYVG